MLGEGNLGIERIKCSKAHSLVVLSMNYYRAASGKIYAVLGNQAEDVTGSIQYGTYNRFLGMQNWLKLVNLTTEERVVTVVIHQGKEEQEHRVRLKAWGGVDLGLHDEARYGIAVNKLGMLEVRDSVPGGVFAQVVRVKPLDDGGLDFIMATKVR